MNQFQCLMGKLTTLELYRSRDLSKAYFLEPFLAFANLLLTLLTDCDFKNKDMSYDSCLILSEVR